MAQVLVDSGDLVIVPKAVIRDLSGRAGRYAKFLDAFVIDGGAATLDRNALKRIAHAIDLFKGEEQRVSAQNALEALKKQLIQDDVDRVAKAKLIRDEEMAAAQQKFDEFVKHTKTRRQALFATFTPYRGAKTKN